MNFNSQDAKGACPVCERTGKLCRDCQRKLKVAIEQRMLKIPNLKSQISKEAPWPRQTAMRWLGRLAWYLCGIGVLWLFYVMVRALERSWAGENFRLMP